MDKKNPYNIICYSLGIKELLDPVSLTLPGELLGELSEPCPKTPVEGLGSGMYATAVFR